MKKLIPCLIIIIIFYDQPKLICQTKFASQNLKNLYECLPLDCRFIPNESAKKYIHSLNSKNIIQNSEVKINFYLDGDIIEDIGVAIIDSTIKTRLKSDDIVCFIERKILELLLISRDYAMIDNLHENDISIMLNNNPIVSCEMLRKAFLILSDRYDFKMKSDSLHYELSWNSTDNNSVIFSFPATNTLIRGMDKKELDEEIIKNLVSIHYNIEKVDEETLSIKNIIVANLSRKDSIYCIKKDSFLIGEINNDLYLKTRNGALQYIYEPRYFQESLCNLIQLPILNNNLTVNVIHNIYGNEKIKYTMKFYDLLMYFRKNCIFFTGIENKTGDGITAIVILLNKKLNVLHIMFLEVSKALLFDENKLITIDLRTNIPTNNIENLFGEYIPQKTRFKVLVK